jgi:hypothetical protein
VPTTGDNPHGLSAAAAAGELPHRLPNLQPFGGTGSPGRLFGEELSCVINRGIAEVVLGCIVSRRCSRKELYTVSCGRSLSPGLQACRRTCSIVVPMQLAIALIVVGLLLGLPTIAYRYSRPRLPGEPFGQVRTVLLSLSLIGLLLMLLGAALFLSP